MRRRTRALPALSVLLAAACAGTAAGPADAPAPSSDGATALAAAAATITPADVRARIAYLASDALRGRDTPSPGLDTAAAWIAREFRAMGLEPAGDSGTFIQRFPYRSGAIDRSAASLSLVGGGDSTALRLGRDFFVIPSPQQARTAGPLAFAGNAGSVGTLEPAQGSVLSFFIAGTEVQGEWEQRAINAMMSGMRAGARALVLILDPAFTEEQIGWVADQTGGAQAPIPVFGIRYDIAQHAFTAAGADLEALRAGPAPTRAVAVGDARAAASLPMRMVEARVPNVAAVLPGSDPSLRDTYVVFTAHIDHVGVGAPDATGDSIFNGADDDASGTAALLEIAQAFAALPQRPARSLLFLGVSGEEKGLLGSAYYVNNPTVPKAAMVANINMDMIGRNHPDTVVAIGQDYSSLGTLVQQVAATHPELRLVVAPDLWPEERLFYRSDHFNFAVNDIPALFFTTGLHEDYHKQSDEVEKIDAEKESRIARLVFYLGHAIASAPQRPTWTEAGRAAMSQIPRGSR